MHKGLFLTEEALVVFVSRNPLLALTL